MIDLLITCDESDEESGSYFDLCLQDVLAFLGEIDTSGNSFRTTVVPTEHCNQVYIEMKVDSILPNRFIFIGYSHGNHNGLCAANNIYVHKGSNTHIFANSVFYSIACQVGSELAKDLVDKGCAAFIGYNNKSFYINDFLQTFINCDNAGIKAFISGGRSISEAYSAMLSYYDLQIQKAYFNKQPFLIQALVNTREALVFLGEPDLKFIDIIA